MRHKDTREKITEHSKNSVPFIVIDDQLKQKNIQMKSGKLANVAPTILNLMNIKKPNDMSAESLI
jgi:2,3-bisphosphoglycerate-independent phosphoglycerate mutase